MTLTCRDGKVIIRFNYKIDAAMNIQIRFRFIFRLRSNSAAASSRVRCNSVLIPSYPRLVCDNCDYETRSRDNLILHLETQCKPRRQQNGQTQAQMTQSQFVHQRQTGLAERKQLTSKVKPPRRSTFSFRSRASSVSSFSSSNSSGSSSSSSSPGIHGHYNTEMFWNQYRRFPDDNVVTNMIRRSKLRRFIPRDKKYASSFDLFTADIM